MGCDAPKCRHEIAELIAKRKEDGLGRGHARSFRARRLGASLINTKAAWGHRRQEQVGLVLSTQSPCKQIDGRMRWFLLSDGRLKEVTK
jgi:hypothetical protein